MSRLNNLQFKTVLKFAETILKTNLTYVSGRKQLLAQKNTNPKQPYTYMHAIWNDITHLYCYCLIIPVICALTTDNESEDVLLLHPSPRLCRNPSTTLETVSATDSVIVLDASVATTDRTDWSPKDELLITGKILSHLKTAQHCSLYNFTI